MLLIGVILLLIVIAIVVFFIITGSGANATSVLTWDALNLQWEGTALLVFGAGALTLALLVLAWMLITAGVRRRMHKGQEMRRLRRLEKDTGPGRAVPGGSPRGTDDTSPTRKAPHREDPGAGAGHDDRFHRDQRSETGG